MKNCIPASYINYETHLPDTVDFWCPTITGDWAEDNARGRAYADEAMGRLACHQNPTVLGHIIKSIIGKASWSGVEVGFFHRVSEYLIAYAIILSEESDV